NKSYWSNGSDNHTARDIRLLRSQPLSVTTGEEYTLSDSSSYVSAIDRLELIPCDENGNGTGDTSTRIRVYRGQSLTFTAVSNYYQLCAIAMTNFTIRLSFLSNSRIKMKLELGNRATPWSASPKDSLQQTDFVIKAGSFLLGNREVGGDVFASGI